MNTNQVSQSSCNLCGQIKDQIHGDVCNDCAEQTLLRHLPQLKRVLEDKYGLMLDRWLAHGRLLNVKWIAEPEFQVSRDRLKHLVNGIIEEAVDKELIKLDIPGDESSNPTKTDELVKYIYEQCTDELQQLITDIIAKALETAPTKEAERYLIEVAYGKKRVQKRYTREEAISALVLSSGTVLTLPMKALLEMRYRADSASSYYVQVIDGEINSVWNEIKKSLPEGVANLIYKDNSF